MPSTSCFPTRHPSSRQSISSSTAAGWRKSSNREDIAQSSIDNDLIGLNNEPIEFNDHHRNGGVSKENTTDERIRIDTTGGGHRRGLQRSRRRNCPAKERYRRLHHLRACPGSRRNLVAQPLSRRRSRPRVTHLLVFL